MRDSSSTIRGLAYSAQAFGRGWWAASSTMTRAPERARAAASAEPAGPGAGDEDVAAGHAVAAVTTRGSHLVERQRGVSPASARSASSSYSV